MKKSEIVAINNEVLSEWENATKEISDLGGSVQAMKLGSCKAKVFETRTYVFLVSYSAVVAFIDKRTGTLYDILRYAYDYTATSVQHIAKFRSAYCWKDRKTYRNISDTDSMQKVV